MSLKGYNGPANLPDRYVASSARSFPANDNAQAAAPRARSEVASMKHAAFSCEIVELV